MKHEEPHLLILMGPFVDEKHKKIESGNVKIADCYLQYEDLFQMLMNAVGTCIHVLTRKII